MWRWLIFLAVPALTIASEYSDLYNDTSSDELYESALAYWDLNHNETLNQGSGDSLMGFCSFDGIDELHGAAILKQATQLSPKITLSLAPPNSCPISPGACANGFTVAFWLSLKENVTYDLNNETCMLLSLNDTSMGGFQILFDRDSGSIVFQAGSMMVYSTEAYNATDEWVWNHLGMIYRPPSQGVEVFTNGQQAEMSNTPLTSGQVQDIFPADAYPGCEYVALDEIAIWDRQLSETEMLALRLDPFNLTHDHEEPTTEAVTTEEPTTEAETTGVTTKPSTTKMETTSPEPSETSTSEQASTLEAKTTTNLATPPPMHMTSVTRVTTASTTTATSMTSSTITAAGHVLITGAVLTLKDVENMISGSINYNELTKYLQIVDSYLSEKGGNFKPGDGPIVEEIFKITGDILSDLMVNVQAQKRRSFLELYMNIVNKVIEINTNITNESFITFPSLAHLVDHVLNSYLKTGSDSDVPQHVQVSNKYTDTVMSMFDNQQEKLTMTFNQSGDDVEIVVPRSIFGNGILGRVAGTTYYKGIQNQLPMMLQASTTKNVTKFSTLVGILVNADSTVNFNDKVSVATTHAQIADDEEVTCAYLKVVEGKETVWSTDGCTTVSEGHSSTKCMCDHLTNFAVLVSVKPLVLDKANTLALDILTYLGLTISIICLILTLVILNFLRQLNSLRISILKHTSAALLIAQSLFLIGSIDAVGQSKVFCKVMAALTHYFFLTVFCWMLLQGVHLYIKVRRAMKSHVGLLYFCLFGWGFPLVIVAISFGVENMNYGIKGICWISVENGPGALIAFIGPAYFILLVNLMVVGMVMHVFMSVKVNQEKSEKDKIKSGLRAILVMVPILGLTWLFGLLMIGGGLVFVYLFVIFNCMQGAAIFLFHVVLNDEVKQALIKKRNKIAASQDSNTLFSKVLKSGVEQSTCDTTAPSGKF